MSDSNMLWKAPINIQGRSDKCRESTK